MKLENLNGDELRSFVAWLDNQPEYILDNEGVGKRFKEWWNLINGDSQ